MTSPLFAILLHHAASLHWPHGDGPPYRNLQCTPPPGHATNPQINPNVLPSSGAITCLTDSRLLARDYTASK